MTLQTRASSPSVPVVSHFPIRQFFANVQHTFKLHAHCDLLSSLHTRREAGLLEVRRM